MLILSFVWQVPQNKTFCDCRYGFFGSLQDIKQGTGSGFLWDAEHIVTNYHVIKDACFRQWKDDCEGKIQFPQVKNCAKTTL